MTPLLLRRLRWQLGTAVMLALLCAIGSGVGLTVQPANRSARQASSIARPLPPRPATSDTAQAYQAQEEEKKRISLALEQLNRDLPALEAKIKDSKPLTEKTDSSELKQLDDLRKKPPPWDKLGFDRQRPEDSKIIEVWVGPDITDDQVGQVVSILKAKKDAFTQQAANGANNRTETQKRFIALRDKLKTDGQNRLSMLVIDVIGDNEIQTLWAKIKELFSGGIRAVAGENFINSVGMEMVWVPTGKFWMGKTEVTSSAYKAIMGSGSGGDSPAEGISWDRASKFCQNLSNQEEDPPAPPSPNSKLRPLGTQYELPGVKQWRTARDAAGTLGMSGFSDGLSEWSSDTHASGLSQNYSFTQGVNVPVQSSWALAMNGNTAQPLPGALTGSWVQTGKDRIVIWQGRLGFRVILIPASP